MKKLILTIVVGVGLSASVFAQGTMLNIDNLNGTGTATATSLGLFFNSNLTPATIASINATVFGGPDAGSLSQVFNGTLISGGGGIYLDSTFQTYNVTGVAAGANAVLQVLAWTGAAASYAAADPLEQFLAYNGSAYVLANSFTFSNPTGGGGTPQGLPKSLDGMPAMVLAVPEPSVFALLGIGAGALMLIRRRK